MYVVALTSSTPSLSADIPLFASLLSMTPYDFGLRARAGLPALLSAFTERSEAERFADNLRSRGYGAICCDSNDFPGADRQLFPRDFRVGAGVLSVSCEGGRSFDISFADVAALIRATTVLSKQTSSTTQSTKLSVGRALASGGMMLTKKVESTTVSSSEQRQSVLYLFTDSGLGPLIFREAHLHYQGLGSALAPVTSQNFARLIELLRREAPHALYDDRFVTQKRKMGMAALSAPGTKNVAVSLSNATETDLAAYLLVVAYRDGQL